MGNFLAVGPAARPAAFAGSKMPLMRWLALAYGLLAYAAFGAVFAVYLPFLANVGPFDGIDERAPGSAAAALAVDVGLVALFGVSHSVMARRWFKERWVRVVPSVIERSTYVLVASLVLGLLFWQWRSLPAPVWDVGPPGLRLAFWLLQAAGVALVVFSTFLIDHADLFGLRQVWLYARRKPYSSPPFRERSLYRYMRHPLMLGFMIWFWAAPTMSVGHLLLALGFSVYVMVGVVLEERDLLRDLGESYRDYRRRVGAILPRLPRG